MGLLAAFAWLRSHKARLLRGLLLVLLWLALLDLPCKVASSELDSSWKRCLGHFLTNRCQCGVDYVWTYGPLGYFVHEVYDTDLFWWKYAWELVVKFMFAWLLLRWAGLLGRRWMRAAFVVLLLLSLAGMVDTLYLFCLMLLGLLPLRDEGCRTAGCLAAGTVLLAVLSLTKFTFLLVGAAVWVVVVLAPGLSRRRRAAVAAGYPLVWAIIWCLLGQPLGNIAGFLAASWEIARGYSEAMAVEGDSRIVYAGLAALALFLVLLAAYPLSRLRRRENLLGLVLLSGSMFLIWKHGFIRQSTHTYHFFGYLLLAPFAAEGLLGGAASARRLRVGLATTLIVIGLFGRRPVPQPADWSDRLGDNVGFVVAPARLKRFLDKQQEELAAKWALPNIQRLVRQQPVDLISWSQGVLLLNRLNYRPRPIFQSYSAYTPDLLEHNAAFYRSERAPAFVLCRFRSLDDRLPALEDGLTLLELFHRYRPVAREKGLLLLKRFADAGPNKPVERPVLLQQTVAFEDEVGLDEPGPVPKLLSIRIEDTLLGRLRKALFRPPSLFLDLHTRDGGSYSYRLIPGMAGSDFLLDPLLRDHEDIEALYAGRPLPRVRSFSIHAGPDARTCYQERLEISVRGAEGLTP